MKLLLEFEAVKIFGRVNVK